MTGRRRSYGYDRPDVQQDLLAYDKFRLAVDNLENAIDEMRYSAIYSSLVIEMETIDSDMHAVLRRMVDLFNANHVHV